MKYKYETHLHTFESSACGVSSGAEQAEFHAKMGYAGIFVTDHFFNGNSAVPYALPWDEKVEHFCLGYEHAKEVGDKLGLDVFFGMEWNYNGMEFLTYGIDKQFLLDNPKLDTLKPAEFARRVHKYGGFLSQAHPFREAPYIKEIIQYPELSDAAEVINMGNKTAEMNRKAMAYADAHGLAKTAGSDIHDIKKFSNGGMAFDHRIKDVRDFMKFVSEGRCELLGDLI